MSTIHAGDWVPGDGVDCGTEPGGVLGIRNREQEEAGAV